ncbi:DUF551 domain-containing protein [Salmonella enterica subsp. enterica serovar Brandenburg]|nr:DUF551 domain-containing protein [Salmonella enterica subsp. enterica serovar Brandenburg]EBW5387340.1 DUF551 domain-containing protein [Salmonella enterica subsp. enterica serovar Brandenburg]EBW7887056.1 DUF551 domain-containing protein [Salmonella enterica subsp. enterica serovar Brandenburg]ECA1821300.1 DUF551 domain-containing protein [Salmonella enterica subsp. enterica serovar Brandenburg]ECF2355337.1 DUF551 domain-containing protein [Salmonella enterica subsp. enterica serovar Brande
MTTITKERIELFIKNPLENGLTRGEQMELARIALASLTAEPVSQTYKLPELIEGMEVSIDVSTCDFDAGHRYFGTVTEVSELDTAKNGYILLVQDAEPNFKTAGNSPAIPGGWISCSERMPENGQECLVQTNSGWRYVSFYDARSRLFYDSPKGDIEYILVTHWMPLPAAPKPETVPCTK